MIKVFLRLSLCFAALAALGACAGTEKIALTKADAQWLGGKTATNSLHEKPDFVAMTAGRGMIGVFGVGVMIDEGNRIVEENGVADPARSIATALGRMLAKKLRVDFKPDRRPEYGSAEVSDAGRPAGGSDILLDVETLGWGFRYFPTDWDNYRVDYNARLQVIETATGRVLAQDQCIFTKDYDSSDSAPSHDDLTLNKASGLKRELGEAAAFCARQFSNLILGG